MSKQFWPRPAAAMRSSFLLRCWLPAALTAGIFLIQGCATTPPRPFAGDKASDQNVRVPPAAYRAVLGNYSSQRPIEPAPWHEPNDRVAPAPKKGGQ
jgi:hypothetical protein